MSPKKCAAVWDNDMHPKQDFKAHRLSHGNRDALWVNLLAEMNDQ
ncbi:hypothetical protein [Mesorhizobium sp.]|nr:hypothetical protein [Mesorhizobium sp.]